MKNIYFLSFSGPDAFIPVLWPSAKTFYEKYGKHTSEYNWIPPYIEFYEDIDFIKAEISKNPPSIFGILKKVYLYANGLKIHSQNVLLLQAALINILNMIPVGLRNIILSMQVFLVKYTARLQSLIY